MLPANTGQSLQNAAILRRFAGGAPANLAVGLARLGIKVAFIGKVGNEPFGWHLREVLIKNKVLVEGLRFSDKFPTGLTFAWVNKENGEPEYLFYDSLRADYYLQTDEVDWEWFKSAQIFQFSSTSLAKNPTGETTLVALQTAFEGGQLVSYDVNIRMPAWADRQIARQKMLEVLPNCHIVKLNRHELAFLAEEKDIVTGASKLWQSHFKVLLVTMDNEGCYYRTARHEGKLDAFKVKIADTVGSGDGWMAGFLAKVLEHGAQNFDFSDENKIAEACRFANAVGALTSTKSGAMTALPTRKKTDSFLKSMIKIND
jgi:fructokinase